MSSGAHCPLNLRNRIDGYSIFAIYRELVAGKCNEFLREILGVDKGELPSLFQWTFRFGTIMVFFSDLFGLAVLPGAVTGSR